MRILLLLIMMSNVAFSQSTRSKTITIETNVPALLFQFTEPKTFATSHFSNDREIQINDILGLYPFDFKNDLLSENRAYPNFVSELELHYTAPEIQINEKKDRTGKITKEILIISQITATQYISERGKGYFFKRSIQLSPLSNLKYSALDDVTNFKYKSNTTSKNSILIIKNVTSSTISSIFTVNANGEKIVATEYLDPVNNVQIYKLKRNAVGYIKSAFNTRKKKNYYRFYYIKKWKKQELQLKKYNNILNEFAIFIKNNDIENVKNSINKWKEYNENLDLEERRQRVVYLKTLENIATAYYLINDNKNALIYIQKAQKTSKSYLTLLNINNKIDANKQSEKQEITYTPIPKKLKCTNYFESKNETKIDEIGSYRNKTASNFLYLTMLNKITEKIYHRDRPHDYETVILLTISTLSIPRFYKKSNKEAVNKIKEYKSYIKKLKKELPFQMQKQRFFEKYSYDDIHKNIALPNISYMIKTYKLTDLQTNIVKGLLEKVKNIHLARVISSDTQLEGYNTNNDLLIKNIQKYIQEKKFETEIETEILLSLKYMDTQEHTKNFEDDKNGNILKNIITYFSDFTL